MSHNNVKRAKLLLKTPNPLFEKWISEWIEEASKSGNLLKVNSFQNALTSLKKFPLVLKSGKECLILENFDVNLCIQLDRKLVSYNKNLIEEKSDELVSLPSQESGTLENEAQGGEKTCEQGTQNKKKKSKEYQPAYRSAAYALLLTLHKNETSYGYKGYMTKAELQKEAQPFCDTSLKKAQAGTFYTGWTSMGQLLKKGLVNKSSSPARFSLTEEGRQTAESLSQNDPHVEDESCAVSKLPNEPPEVGTRDLADIIAPASLRSKKKQTVFSQEEEGIEGSQPESNVEEDFVLSPDTFDTILLVDNAETSGSNNINDATVSELTDIGVKFEVRHLKVGDFMWICRSRSTSDELVLPFIVERKRMDDLSKSVTDGRFHEQKFRLKKCGVHNIIYLIEDTGAKKFGIPLASLHQAINNTMVSDEFTVKITSNHFESMKYLGNITTMLTNIFRKKVLFSCSESEGSFDIMDDTAFLLPFKTFITGMGKSRNFKTKEMFIKQLVQLHGISADKAWGIAEIYPTPAALISALKNSQSPMNLLSDIKYGELNRRIGPIISSQLNEFYTKINLK